MTRGKQKSKPFAEVRKLEIIKINIILKTFFKKLIYFLTVNYYVNGRKKESSADIFSLLAASTKKKEKKRKTNICEYCEQKTILH